MTLVKPALINLPTKTAIENLERIVNFKLSVWIFLVLLNGVVLPGNYNNFLIILAVILFFFQGLFNLKATFNMFCEPKKFQISSCTTFGEKLVLICSLKKVGW